MAQQVAVDQRSLPRVWWYKPGPFGLVWIAQAGGISLVLLAVLGWPLRTVPPLSWLDLSTAENVIHLLVAAPLIHAGFVRRDSELARRAIAIGAVFAAVTAVVGFTPAPDLAVDIGTLPTHWSVVHQMFHVAAAVAFGAVWFLSGQEWDRLAAIAVTD